MTDLMTREALQYIIGRVIESADDTMKERQKNPKNEYIAGMAQAYYETLDIIKNELIVRHEDLSQYNLDQMLEAKYH